jgi:hypothetical protein
VLLLLLVVLLCLWFLLICFGSWLTGGLLRTLFSSYIFYLICELQGAGAFEMAARKHLMDNVKKTVKGVSALPLTMLFPTLESRNTRVCC